MLRTLLHKTLLTAIAILLGGWAVVAQQYVVKGTTLNFKVDEVTGYAYHWSVTHTATRAVAYLTSETFESGDYVFDNEGEYVVKVYPEDLGTRCFGEPLIMMVVVDGAAPTAEFDDLEVPYVCSANNGGDANGKINVTVNYSGPKPWTFKISVDRAPAVMPDGAKELYVNSFEFELEIPNTSGKTHRAEILLVDAKTVSGIPVTEDLVNQTLEVDVMALPNTVWGDYEPVIQSGTIQSYTATIEKNENYELFIPAGATVLNETTTKLSDKYHSELSFDVQWGNTPGDYQIKLLERTAFDCAGDTIYADITLVESFSVSLGGDISICEGESATLTPTIDFGGTYTYLWSDGSKEPTLAVTESGTYSVTAKDSDTGKSSSASVNVEVLKAPIVDLGADYELAEAETKVLDAGNPGLTYSWSTGETSQSISVNTSNTYSVNVTSLNGCVGSDEIVISSSSDVFAISLGADINICDGEEVILNPNPSISQNYAYLWSNGAGNSTLTVSESGTYSVTMRDDAGNEKTDEIEVIVHALPIVDLGEDFTLYDGETATLDAGNSEAGLVYEWNTGENTQTITVSDENVYSVKVTAAYSCYNTDEISVVKKDGHKFSVDLGGDIEICMGDRVYLEPIIDRVFTSDPSYKWIPSESTEKGIFVDQSGKYCVEVTDPFGNTEGDCIELTVNATPIVDLGEDIIAQTGETVILNAENSGSFYQWSTNDITQTLNVDQAGEYWVEVTNQQSCMGRDTINVLYPEGDQFVGLASGFSPNGDGKNDVLFVRGNNIGSMNLIIYNRLGHKIFQSNRQDVGWDGTYRGVKQDMDVYVFFLQVTFLDGSSVQKRGNVTLLY
ncbi:hypothetical protein BZG02_04885 [Labilibaculum filiforme]|uniref:Ig-like domain-containing protein n=1 Tax=Labilibaculum filiforme TaxID=1940526 RepID=A0A2N3I4C9_9BACT|nr:gliding motility-associated C-terminal domain-containing protein [Labilibaculum filiforme]PKQ65165.1 hypothetical protein BZG02_04885 [Labilibaculum filiforme]